MQFLDGRFGFESHLLDYYALADLEWPHRGHVPGILSNQCDES